LPGERNPQSAAEEFAPPPQGESVLDASMMAELIVTKKEIAPQLKKSAGTSRARPKSPSAVVNRCSRWKDLEASTTGLVPCFGAFVVPVFAASNKTPVEGKIGTYTAEWTLEN
jgi:ABC-type nickel/cobalt efflux system permease component RcnA